MDKIEVTVEMDKETKNTYKYTEVQTDSPPTIDHIYIKKYKVGKHAPKKLKITISEA